jgi:hypothetical protein
LHFLTTTLGAAAMLLEPMVMCGLDRDLMAPGLWGSAAWQRR